MSGEHSAGAFGVSAAWRRGIMHAVERLDMVAGPRQRISKGRAIAAIAEVRRVLDELTEFQRQHTPATYQAAFDLCAADLRQAQNPSNSNPLHPTKRDQEGGHG